MEEQLTKKQRRELKRQQKLANTATKQQRETWGRLALWGGVLVVVGGIIFTMIKYGGGAAPVSGGSLADAVTATDWIRGNPKAATTLVEYSDLQCPACAAAEPIVQDLIKNFGDKLRVVYRHYPLAQHARGLEAARAAEAAGKQGKFWEMHDLLFDKQSSWSAATDAEKTFTEFAAQLGLNSNQFTSDYNSSDIAKKITDQRDGGDRSAVNATPTFFLNDKKVPLQTFDDLRAAVANAVK